MANITAQDNSLSFLTDTLGGFVGRAATKLDAFSSELEGMVDTIFMAISYGYVDSVSSSRIVISTYYPTYAQMIINGSGMTGNSFSINRISYSEYDGFYIRMSGNVRGNVYGDVSGAVTSAVIGDSEQSIAYVGSISMTTGAARYSSLTYTLRDVSGEATTTFSYGGSFVEDDYGVIRGTVTSFSYGRDVDGSGSGAAQTLMSMTGLSRYVEMDIDSGRPFGFLPANTATFFADMLNGADSISGGTGNDTLYGYDGNDLINGGAGADVMDGGDGDDVYYVDNAGDVVVEAAAEGTDLVLASVSHTLDDNVENLTLIGSAIDGTGNQLGNTLTGNAQANVLTGLGGIDTLIGGGGLDTLIGGEGDDIYVIDRADEIVTELADEGNDTVRIGYANAGRTAVTVALHDNVENLELLGAGLFNLVGNAESNTLTGNGSANVIDGGAGADAMTGGLGNDTYVVDDAGDVVTETAVKGSGVDLVRASVDYTLTANVENLTLEGSALEGTGNELGNVLTGNALDNELFGLVGNDVLAGGDGNDLLDGGEGIDSMSGGAGDDTYVVDNVRDVVSEGLNAGTDTVRSALSYALGANVENLELTGTAHLSGTGNALANVITGNSGNNVLSGGLGDDVLLGGAGNDALLGGAGNDWLSGGEGLNTLTGGAGEDVFYFDAAPAPGTLQTVADFSLIDDRIVFDATVFDALGAGFNETPAAMPSELVQIGSGSAATDGDVRLIYDTASGALYYDADGNGAGDAVQLAQFTGKPLLSADHFEVLAS
ncbi:calcium-binding protein [Methyloversatilis discipulorum]|uniref:calcium-binding protein n=1 Tax=Methyloversatilis discipulorum TaxID=1119528 RepID=UPI0004B737DC|nr:calcium-binding protein [Methyloversatilis discipulorum]